MTSGVGGSRDETAVVAVTMTIPCGRLTCDAFGYASTDGVTITCRAVAQKLNAPCGLQAFIPAEAKEIVDA